MARASARIQGKGADQDVVILVPDGGEALRIGTGRLRAGEGLGHVGCGEAQLLSVAIADGQHALVGGDSLEQAADLLGIVAGEKSRDLVADGVEHQAGSQLDVPARPLLHEGCRKGQHGQDDDGRHEQCDAAKAEDDPQNTQFLKKTDTVIEAVGQPSRRASKVPSMEGRGRTRPSPLFMGSLRNFPDLGAAG